MPTLCHRIGARSEKISRFFESSRSTDSRCCVPSESGGELDNDDGIMCRMKMCKQIVDGRPTGNYLDTGELIYQWKQKSKLILVLRGSHVFLRCIKN